MRNKLNKPTEINNRPTTTKVNKPIDSEHLKLFFDRLSKPKHGKKIKLL